MIADIVVIANPLSDDFSNDWFWRPFMNTGFGSYYTTSGEGGAGAGVTIEAATTAPTSNYTIPAKDYSPTIKLKNVTKKQYNDFLLGLDNIKNDPELLAQFQKLKEGNNIITITVATEMPPRSSSDGLGAITFRAVSNKFDGSDQSVMEKTSVDIVVNGNLIREDANWESSFKGVIAHELTHLKRDSEGRFLEDYQGSVTTHKADDATYNNLYNMNKRASYSDSLDVTNNLFGEMSILTGTNGNNQFEMSKSNSVAVYTGAGNDFIRGGNQVEETIYVNGNGRKVIVQEGNGHDMISISTIPSLSKLVVSRVGQDTYLTSLDSEFSPENDPDAVIVLGQSANSPDNAVEVVMTADANTTNLYDWKYWSGMAAAMYDPDLFLG